MSSSTSILLDDGEVVYHYTSPEGLLGILESRKLWFTECSVLNDRSEGQYIFQKTKELLLKGQYNEHYIDFVLKALDNKPTSKCFICSFSRSDDCLPLWRNYTKSSNYAGYNIAFSVKALKNALAKYFMPFNPHVMIWVTVYDNNYLEDIINATLKKYYKIWLNKRDKFGLGTFLLADLRIFRFQCKHYSYSAENEVRCIIQISGDDFDTLLRGKEEIIKFRNVNGLIAPYVEIPINIHEIKRVTLSPYIQDIIAMEQVNLLCKKHGIDCEIKTSNIPVRY